MVGSFTGRLVLAESTSVGLLPFGADIHGLWFEAEGGTLRLSGSAGEGLTARQIGLDLTDGARFTGNSFLGPAHDGFVAADFGGETQYFSASLIAGELGAGDGGGRSAVTLSHLNSGFAGDSFQLVGLATAQAQLVFAARTGQDGLAVASVGDGVLSGFSALPDAGEGRILDMATLSVGGEAWLLASSNGTDSVFSYSVSAEGAVSYRSDFGAAEGLGVGDATALRAVVADGQPYVLLAGAESSSISVLALEPDGSFRVVDHVLDAPDTRFAGIVHLETAEIGGVTYVLAAGSDDGFSLFRMRPDGKLLHLGAVADADGVVLDNPSAFAMAGWQDALHIAASSGTEAGVSHFRVDLSGTGATISGTGAGDQLTGTAADDMILGAGGDDVIAGMAGNDILIDGAGSDLLIGGAGRDLFILHVDGQTDTIQDFERGLDQLDLSFIPGLYSLDHATVQSTADGARVSFRDEVLVLRAADGNPLTRTDLIRYSAFNLDRPPIVLNGDPVPNTGLVAGTDDDDLVIGTAGSETLSGGLGNDVLDGRGGGDRLFGGAGSDAVSYAAGSAVTVDLEQPDRNSGDAAGDRYFSIEAVIGSGFDDVLCGTAGSDNLSGGAGNDRLEGRGGDDLLSGDGGDDWFSGGAGKDRFDGGEGHDLVSYADAAGGLRAYLARPDRNTGEARGDSYVSIEGLEGSVRGDRLYGDGNANTLSGGGGGDRLYAGAGNDLLFGGRGRDILVGSDGDDTLSGGGYRDTLKGGSGFDMSSYADAASGVTAHLGRGEGRAGDAKGDRFYSIEGLIGSEFDDRLFGSGNADEIRGGGGNDLIRAGNRNDRLFGGTGDDRIEGNKGHDKITGGAGNDFLKGGRGRDVFFYEADFGHDRIGGFNAREDRLNLDLASLGLDPMDAAQFMQAHAGIEGRDMVLRLGEEASITLLGYTDFSGLTDALILG